MSQTAIHPAAITDADSNQITRHWGLHLTMGIVAVMLGMVGLALAGLITLASVIFFGWLLVFGGVAHLVHAFRTRVWKGALMHATVGLLWMIMGGLIIAYPGAGAMTLTMVLALFFFLSGAVRIIGAMTLRFPQWGWAVVGGVVSLLLGVLILAQWPISAFWVIGVFLSIELIMNGWALIALAVTAHRPETPHGARPAFG
jgi:uncharacterized membrane protein HdeD (DUF308 family)